MSALSIQLAKSHSRIRTRTKTHRASEAFWFGTAFLLSLALGPFSAPIVLFAVLRLASEGWEEAPEL